MSQVELKIDEGIAVISVSRPEALNALNREIVDDMDVLIEQVSKDSSVRCLILHSDKNFAAGADIKAMAVCDEEGAKAFAFSPTYNKITALGVPVIAAIEGYALGGGMDKAEYTKAIKEITEGLKKETPKPYKGKKVIVTGLMTEPVEILDIFEENDIAIVGDEMSLGSRQWRTPARRDVTDVYQRMAYMVADQKGDTFLYEPEKLRGQIMIDDVKAEKADGIVIFMMKFCDPEEYDYPIYKKEVEAAGVPMLYLEVDQQLNSFEQIRTRIQSFNEMLI